MVRQRSLRIPGPTVLGAIVLATLSPAAVVAQDVDSICTEVLANSNQSVGYWEGLSRGAKVIGSPVPGTEAVIDRCHLGRWNEPDEGMRRMVAFVQNDSESRFFRDAYLTIWAHGAHARARSEYPVEIAPQRAALFLLVGPLQAISLRGSYSGPEVRFRERAPPSPCGTFTLDQTLQLVEALVEADEPESEMRARIPNLDPASEVEVIRIRLTDGMITESGEQEPIEEYDAYLHDDMQETASIGCS